MDRRTIIKKLEEKLFEIADFLSENQQIRTEVVKAEKQLHEFFKDKEIDQLVFDIEKVRIKRTYKKLEDQRKRIDKQKKLVLEQLERLEGND